MTLPRADKDKIGLRCVIKDLVLVVGNNFDDILRFVIVGNMRGKYRIQLDHRIFEIPKKNVWVIPNE